MIFLEPEKQVLNFEHVLTLAVFGRGNYSEYKNTEMVRVTGKKCINKLENRETYTV